jgi:hypothetical protein
MRFYPHPFSMEETENWIALMHARYARDGFALLAVDDLETGAFLGNVGPMVQEVDGTAEIELGGRSHRRGRDRGSRPRPREHAASGCSKRSAPTT